MATYQLNVNGARREVTVDPATPLLWVLREDLKMTGTKYGCGVSACGACTVHVAGVATRSCMVPVSMIGDRPVVTLFGPTEAAATITYYNRERCLSLSLDCQPCMRRTCPLVHHRCMRELPVDAVYAEVETLLDADAKKTAA